MAISLFLIILATLFSYHGGHRYFLSYLLIVFFLFYFSSLGFTDDEITYTEMVSLLCMSDQTFSQLQEMIPETCGQPSQTKNFSSILHFVSEYIIFWSINESLLRKIQTDSKRESHYMTVWHNRIMFVTTLCLYIAIW